MKTMEWISVKDRLPEKYRLGLSENVLTYSNNTISIRYYDFEYNQWTGSTYIEVTHWMPLPEPPKQ